MDEGEVKVTHEYMCEYIEKSTPELNINEKKEVLQIIMNSTIDKDKIHTKGFGTQVLISDIPKPIIIMIYNFIIKKITTKKKQLEYFPDTNTV